MIFFMQAKLNFTGQLSCLPDQIQPALVVLFHLESFVDLNKFGADTGKFFGRL
jgi:hypothetical protein